MPVSNLVDEIRGWSTAEHAALLFFAALSALVGPLVGFYLFGVSIWGVAVSVVLALVLGGGTFAFTVVVRLVAGP